MFEATHNLFEYEKRNWEALNDLTNIHDSPKPHDTEEHYYQGIITAISWDSKDNPIEYSLYMEEGIELILRPQSDFSSLAEFINKKVLVKGMLSKSDFFGDYLLFFSKVTLLRDDINIKTRKVA